MATVAEWIEGARPRTLPNAVAPVIAGTGAAAWLHGAVWWKALLALVVSLAMIVGVNYANDYSDGIRGTDDVRVGPVRLHQQVLHIQTDRETDARALGIRMHHIARTWQIMNGHGQGAFSGFLEIDGVGQFGTRHKVKRSRR